MFFTSIFFWGGFICSAVCVCVVKLFLVYLSSLRLTAQAYDKWGRMREQQLREGRVLEKGIHMHVM